MDKMTYKQFEKIINELGYEVEHDFHVYVQSNSGRTFACISKVDYKQLNLIWPKTRELTDAEKDLMSDACWQLASTPLEDREEQNLYHLKVYPKYSPFFDSDCDYLNIDRDNEMVISTKHETSLYKTIFTEEEINELAKEYDLSLFEKVEVE